MANQDIRTMLKALNIKHWQVAERIGINEGTLSVWLRKELTMERRVRVITAINELKKEKERNGE